MTAKLAGAVEGEVASVRCGKKYYFVAPATMGGVREVPADSLTDCLHASVYDMSMKIKKEQGRPSRKERAKA